MGDCVSKLPIKKGSSFEEDSKESVYTVDYTLYSFDVQCVPRLEPFFFCKLKNQIVNDNCNASETRAGNILRMASSTFIILRAWQHAVVVHPTWASIPLSFSPILHLLHINIAFAHKC